jgi:hypothetical protein
MWGVFVIDRTITIGADTLLAMRASSFPASPAFDPFIDGLSESNSVLVHDDACLNLTRDVPNSITKMNDAVNDLLNSALFDDLYDESRILSIINDYLSYVPSNPDTALGYFINAGITDPDSLVRSDRRALDLTYYTINAAMLYDCLYHAPTSIVPDSVKTKLRNILKSCIDLTIDTIESYDSLGNRQKNWGENIPPNHLYPAFPIVQYRLQMYGAMGLAALLLRTTAGAESDDADPALFAEMSAHLDSINNILLTEPIPSTFPADRRYQGMLAFHTTNSGAYCESLGYQGQLLQMLCPFFTAYKRLSGGSINYYN